MSTVETVWKIQSVQTKEFLIPYPGKGGNRVVTVPHDFPHNHFVFTGPISHGPPTKVTIRGQHNLYIHPGPKKEHLVLAPKPYEWQMVHIAGNFELFPVGEDLYWFQRKATEPFIGLAPGRDVVPAEPFFKLIPAE